MRALYVVNKRLPVNDYRVVYPAHSALCSVSYALPERSAWIPQERFIKVGFGEGFHPADIYHFLELWMSLRQHRREFDFVHFYATSLILFGPQIAALAGLPSLITLTGFGRTFNSSALKYRLLRPIYKLLLRMAIRTSQAVLFQNHSDLRLLSEQMPSSKEKFFYIGSAIEETIVQDKDFDSPRLRVLLVARLLPDKGIEDFLKVAEILHQKDFEFVLVGPASVGFDDLLSKVRDSHSRGMIEYIGELDSAGVHSQYQKAHILYYPSYGEGMSRVMLEAGYAYLCPIAYDIPANRELLTNRRGFLVPSKDIKQVIQILAELSQNRRCLEQNAFAFQSFITKNYNMTNYTDRMDCILAKLFLSEEG